MNKRGFYVSLLKFGNYIPTCSVDPEFVQMGMPCFDSHANSLASESAITQDAKAFLEQCESLRPRNSGLWCLWTSRAPHILPESHRGKEKKIQMEWNVRKGFPGGSVGKELAYNAGDAGRLKFNPGSGRSPGEWQCNPFQYSCLENPMDRGAWWATSHRIAKNWTHLKRLSQQARGVRKDVSRPRKWCDHFTFS